MDITLVASDSLGTRSMATFVETKDCKIFIDPAVALGPSRYKLPPHPIELRRMEEHWEAIKRLANKASIIIVTHYHYDHHDPNEPELYKDKNVLLKHPTEKINRSQAARAEFFLEQLSGLPKSLEYSDGREFKFGETTIKFSPPVFHGPGPKLGYVTQVAVRVGDDCFLFTSDIEGPCVDEQAEFILDEDPGIIYLDGPLSYMLGFRYSQKSLDASLENISKILRETKVAKLIIDHHFLRDIKWRERLQPVLEVAEEEGKKILTAAEFLDKENEMLEARRRELYSTGVN
ncbi:MAG: hypothetical protein V3T58_02250 [Candidatus Hydrothermarchaeales archaeon]